MPWILRDGEVLASLEIARDRAARRRGLLGRDGIDGALLIEPASSVHTIGMRFEIDVAHLDRECVVVRVTTMKRHRVGMPVPRAHAVIEAEAGTFARWELKPGDQLEIRRVSGDGVLVLVGTPIGNLGDLSPRAIEALRTADAICCEDTRRAGRLLMHAGIERRPLIVVNDHTEVRQLAPVLRRLAAGERVAVITDAGMPGISDPGERLARAALREGVAVEVVPGPSAAVTALVVSGLPTGRFVFEGFLPRKGSGRTERLAVLASEPRTTVLYEAPHRLLRTLTDLAAALGADRRVAVARELTKLYEEVFRGTLADAALWAEAESPRGEVAIVVDGAPPASEPTDDDVSAALTERLAAGASARDAAAEVAAALGVAKRRAYALAVGLSRP